MGKEPNVVKMPGFPFSTMAAHLVTGTFALPLALFIVLWIKEAFERISYRSELRAQGYNLRLVEAYVLSPPTLHYLTPAYFIGCFFFGAALGVLVFAFRFRRARPDGSGPEPGH